MHKKTSLKGVLILLTAAVVWGFAFVAQTIGADQVPPFFFNFVRFFVGSFSLIPVVLLFEGKSRNKEKTKITLKGGCIAGVILFLASYTQQVGIQLTDASGKAGFITGLYMILVPVLGLFLGRKTGIFTWVGALFGVGGLFLICLSGTRLVFTLGDGLLLLCALLYSFHIMVIDHYGHKIDSLRFSMIQFAVAGLLSLIGFLLFEEVTLSGFRSALMPILYCGIMSTGVAYTLQVVGQKHSDPTTASVILSTEAVFSAIGGALILGERMSVPAYVGCGLIFFGILLSQLKSGTKRARHHR